MCKYQNPPPLPILSAPFFPCPYLMPTIHPFSSLPPTHPLFLCYLRYLPHPSNFGSVYTHLFFIIKIVYLASYLSGYAILWKESLVFFYLYTYTMSILILSCQTTSNRHDLTIIQKNCASVCMIRRGYPNLNLDTFFSKLRLWKRPPARPGHGKVRTPI